MRTKVLELLFTVLANSSGDKLFHNTTNGSSPIFEASFMRRHNKDGSSDLVQYSGLNFTLHFKDDDPEIVVFTSIMYSNTKELYKTSWLGIIKEYTTIYNVEASTHVKFGDYTFNLTEEETNKLFEATKKSYDKHLLLADEFNNEKHLFTIHKRLGYYGPTRDN
jgi:hypothetical protein